MFKEKLELIKSVTTLKNEIKALEEEKQAKIKGLNQEIEALEQERQNKVEALPLEDKKILSAVYNARETIDGLLAEIKSLESKKIILQEEYIELNDEVLYQSYGIFVPEYRYDLASEYKVKIDEIIALEKRLVKDKKAFVITEPMTLGGSASKGLKMQQENGQLAVMAFRAETDDTIKTISTTNFQNKVKNIDKIFVRINKLNKSNCVEISEQMKVLAHKKLELLLEHKLKIEDEKEQRKEQDAILREQKKAQAEMEKEFKKLEAEKQKFLKEQVALTKQLALVSTDEEKEKINNELAKIAEHVETIDNEESSVTERLANTRAGHVYIISNIGSFGEEVYKIGMTRRFEPLDRVKELGDASVPFTFDVHALIFTEDAYALETQLHNHFAHKRVNKMNNRKEFFNVTLDEIKHVVHNVYEKPVSFIDTPEALDYRETLVLERQ